MPSYLTYGSCTIKGELADATLALRENIADRVLALNEYATLLNTEVTAIAATTGASLKADLNILFALGFTPSIQAGLCIPPITSTRAAEDNLATRDGTSVVGGRVLLPGDVDLTCLRVLQRLLGGLPAAKLQADALPAGTFLWITTYIQRTSTGTTVCNPTDTTTETEVVLGFNVAFSEAVRTRGIALADLRAYVFWGQYANATPSNYQRLQVLGCPEAELPFVLLGEGRTVVQVCTLLEGSQYNGIVTQYPAAVAEEVVSRGPATLNPYPTPAEIQRSLRVAGLARSPGSRNNCGTTDASDPASNILMAIDFPVMFNIPDRLASCQTEAASSEGLSAILSVLDSVQSGAQTSLNVLKNVQWTLNDTNALVPLISSLLDQPTADLLTCIANGLVPSAAISFAIPTLQRMAATLRAGDAAYGRVLDLMQSWFASYAMLTCTGISLVQSLSGTGRIALGTPRLPSFLSCIPLDLTPPGFTLPPCFLELLPDMTRMLELVQDLASRVQTNIQTSRRMYRDATAILEGFSAADAGLAASLRAAIDGTVADLPRTLMATGSSLLPTSPVCSPTEGASFVTSLRTALAGAIGLSPTETLTAPPTAGRT